MAQGTLHGHHVAAGRDQAGGVEVPEVVQREAGDARGPARLPPPPPGGALIHRLARGGLEQPARAVGAGPVRTDVPVQQLQQLVRQVDRPLAPVLGRADLQLTAVALHLPGDR
jgi:hypothetical protein